MLVQRWCRQEASISLIGYTDEMVRSIHRLGRVGRKQLGVNDGSLGHAKILSMVEVSCQKSHHHPKMVKMANRSP